jgi:predicted dehydrogenase
MPIGFGIVGCGMIANFHAKAIADLRGAKLIGGCDRAVEYAQRFADANGCQAFASVDEMLAAPGIDVVTICTPSGAHMEPALAAIHAGKHVIVEKPLEITLARCDKMIAAAEKKNVIVSTIFPSRFHESSQLIKQAIDANRFGKMTLGDAIVKWYRSQAYYDSGAWRGTWELDGGGALMNQAIHSVDLLLWLMGPVRSVTARTATLAHERIAVEDVVVANLEFENGALGTIEASTAVYPGYLKRIEIHGSEGSAILEEEDLKAWDFAKSARADAAIRKRMAGKTQTGGGASDPAAIGHHGHTSLFRDVVQAIRTDKQPLIDGKEGRRSVEVILAIYKSAETGRPVELPLSRDPVWKNRQSAAKAKK